MSSSKQPDSHTQADPMNQLGAIQHIIMGPFMAEVNEKLKGIEEQLDQDRSRHEAAQAALQLALAQEIRQGLTQLGEQIRNQEARFQTEIEKLGAEKTDRNELGQLLVELGQALLRNKV